MGFFHYVLPGNCERLYIAHLINKNKKKRNTQRKIKKKCYLYENSYLMFLLVFLYFCLTFDKRWDPDSSQKKKSKKSNYNLPLSTIDLAKPSVHDELAHISLVSQEQRNEFVKTLYDTGRYGIESRNSLYLRRHLNSSTCRQYRQFVKEHMTTQVRRSHGAL